MQGLTVFRFPTKSLRFKRASSKAKRLWRKHRKTREKSVTLPKSKK